MAEISTIKEKFESLSSERDKCKVRKIELETQIKVSREELEKKAKILKEEFGVSSVDEAKQELSRLESEISGELQECENALSKFEV